MKDRLLRALARLSSSEYQEAYLVHGSKDEYVTPEDLVEDVASLCQLAHKTEFAAQFQASQLTALLEMIAVIRLHSPQLFAADRVVDPAALVRIDGDWAAIRHAAQGCLVTFGVSPLGLRAEDIDVAK